MMVMVMGTKKDEEAGEEEDEPKNSEQKQPCNSLSLSLSLSSVSSLCFFLGGSVVLSFDFGGCWWGLRWSAAHQMLMFPRTYLEV